MDEIGDIPLATQVKLLRVLEEKEIERVGDHNPIKVDVRVISATNKTLENLIARELFREDLYFRINVFPLNCPPLRDRKEDIPIIVQSFIRNNNTKTGKKILGLTPEALEKLTAYSWPGNVRELRNAVEYAFVLCPSGGIGAQHLPPRIADTTVECVEPARKIPGGSRQREELIAAVRRAGGNQSEAARALKIPRRTLVQKIGDYDIPRGSDPK